MYVIELTAGWYYSDGQYRRGENAHRLEFAERFETEKAAFRCLQGLRNRLAVEFREAKIVEVEDA